MNGFDSYSWHHDSRLTTLADLRRGCLGTVETYAGECINKLVPWEWSEMYY